MKPINLLCPSSAFTLHDNKEIKTNIMPINFLYVNVGNVSAYQIQTSYQNQLSEIEGKKEEKYRNDLRKYLC